MEDEIQTWRVSDSEYFACDCVGSAHRNGGRRSAIIERCPSIGPHTLIDGRKEEGGGEEERERYDRRRTGLTTAIEKRSKTINSLIILLHFFCILMRYLNENIMIGNENTFESSDPWIDNVY